MYLCWAATISTHVLVDASGIYQLVYQMWNKMGRWYSNPSQYQRSANEITCNFLRLTYTIMTFCVVVLLCCCLCQCNCWLVGTMECHNWRKSIPWQPTQIYVFVEITILTNKVDQVGWGNGHHPFHCHSLQKINQWVPYTRACPFERFLRW